MENYVLLTENDNEIAENESHLYPFTTHMLGNLSNRALHLTRCADHTSP